MATKRQTVRLKKSKLENLYRHVNGTYYARVMVAGKAKERSLRTSDYNLAAAKLPETLKDLRGASEEHNAGTLAEAVLKEADRDDPTIKSATRHYYQQLAKNIVATLPSDVATKKLPQVSVGDLKAWQALYAKKASVTRHNGALALLRRVWNSALDNRQVASSPASKLKRLRPEERKWQPPTKEQFAQLVESIRVQGKAHSEATAAAVEFLAFTGLRISEAQAVTWGDIKNDHIVRRVAKNDMVVRTPLIPAAKDLLERLKVSGVPCGKNDPVMLIKSPRLALESACERLELDHIRIHDLRHIFATRCIESGVEIPTVAAWLGHKDGGILAAKTYGHLIPKHSEAQAAKVLV